MKTYNKTTGEDKKNITDEVSRYAWDNDQQPAYNKIREFIAETWSEYRNNPKPRENATIVGIIIEREYNEYIWKTAKQ